LLSQAPRADNGGIEFLKRGQLAPSPLVRGLRSCKLPKRSLGWSSDSSTIFSTLRSPGRLFCNVIKGRQLQKSLNFENRLTLGEVIGKSLVSLFFLTHGVKLRLVTDGWMDGQLIVRRQHSVAQIKYVHRAIPRCTHTHTHTHTRLTALFPGLPGWAGTRKAKPNWILVKQQTVSGSGISWAICKSAPRSRQITMPAPHHSVFYRPDALPVTQPTASKH